MEGLVKILILDKWRFPKKSNFCDKIYTLECLKNRNCYQKSYIIDYYLTNISKKVVSSPVQPFRRVFLTDSENTVSRKTRLKFWDLTRNTLCQSSYK